MLRTLWVLPPRVWTESCFTVTNSNMANLLKTSGTLDMVLKRPFKASSEDRIEFTIVSLYR